MRPRSVSVCVCAYNEEKNIQHTLQALSSQLLNGFEMVEVIVVSSGSTDSTNDLVREYGKGDAKIRLIIQKRREGKNSAVNLFLAEAKGELLVITNADNQLQPGTLQHLLEPFSDASVGIAGGHPVPVNDKRTLIGFADHMLWDMHHRLSLIYPKIGELVALRNEHLQLPTNMQSDEDILRMELEKKGYRAVYAPKAVVLNKGPTTITDFLKQRTRVNIGERYMKRLFDYDIPTQDASLLISAFGGFVGENKRYIGHMLLVILLEASARAYASIYVALGKGDMTVWSQVTSTKDVGKSD